MRSCAQSQLMRFSTRLCTWHFVTQNVERSRAFSRQVRDFIQISESKLKSCTDHHLNSAISLFVLSFFQFCELRFKPLWPHRGAERCYPNVTLGNFRQFFRSVNFSQRSGRNIPQGCLKTDSKRCRSSILSAKRRQTKLSALTQFETHQGSGGIYV